MRHLSGNEPVRIPHYASSVSVAGTLAVNRKHSPNTEMSWMSELEPSVSQYSRNLT